MLFLRNYATKINKEYYASSKLKIYRAAKTNTLKTKATKVSTNIADFNGNVAKTKVTKLILKKSTKNSEKSTNAATEIKTKKSAIRTAAKVIDNNFLPTVNATKLNTNADVVGATKEMVTDAATKEMVTDTTSINNSNNNNILHANPEYKTNFVKVQMLSKNLHEQIFKQTPRSVDFQHDNNNTNINQLHFINELARHGIDILSSEYIPDIKLKLPKLHGTNIEEHFYSIAKEQVTPYEQLLLPLVQCKCLPTRPKSWSTNAGWTVYDPGQGTATAIDYPTEDGLVFDVEICMSVGSAPTIATAVGTKHWYSWVSPELFAKTNNPTTNSNAQRRYRTMDLIPMGEEAPKIIVGHNVSFDRARLREQYLLEDTMTRFVDTMSLHVCVSGITSYQRALLKSKKDLAAEDIDWATQSSLNSLDEVHRLYCDGVQISKEPRNIFVEGTLSDVRANFQMLMSYCAGDVEATQRVLQKLYPLFAERFPHPATLAGMLEMGSAYLPVNQNWLRYINESDLAYEDLSIEAKYHLTRRANEACVLLKDEKYKENLWLWDEDWSTQSIKMKQPKIQTTRKATKTSIAETTATTSTANNKSTKYAQFLQEKFQYLYDTSALLPARRPLLPGYPAWYRKLCQKPPFLNNSSKKNNDMNWTPGASEISTGMQIAPKLLSLCWEGYPLHYTRENGWGFLVPFRAAHAPTEAQLHNYKLPIAQLVAHCPIPEHFGAAAAAEFDSNYGFGVLDRELAAKLGKREFYANKSKVKDHTSGLYRGAGIWCNLILENCCYFFKLPHKNGNSFRVGNPLARDFLNKFSENVLSSADAAENNSAARVIEIARMMSYWRNNRDRILGQMVVWLPTDELPKHLQNYVDEHFVDGVDDMIKYGAICPQVVVCGTLTRRAMEPTWMTASNSQRERIGSELRAMVQAPRGYKIIGADVDSQELWIASVLGDAYACGEHGATPLGWMTLSGTKANGTDMHSVTAKAVGISRNHAKVINYARIYGAGQNFAEGLLKQFNPTFSATEAKSKAMKMYAITKGKRIYNLKAEFKQNYENRAYSSYEALRLAVSSNRAVDEMFERPHWSGGTESAMFNRLEKIATGEQPVTPFLGCRLSRALESNSSSGVGAQQENRFLPTRVNWVVQSGAVDFLHLMLVSMRWLMGPHIRFCLSFHDELRYLVKDEMAYKAALAMHVTNLLTRSFCASRIGLTDLPMSVAFFASVEIDTVLRKECTMDCKTPSNPHGLKIGYEIPNGESLNVYEAVEKAGDNDMSKWTWIK